MTRGALLSVGLLAAAGCGGAEYPAGRSTADSSHTHTQTGETPTPTPEPTATPTPVPGCYAISALPAVLYIPGCYRLTSDLTITNPAGFAIRVATHGVEIDLDGHELACAGCGSSLEQIGILSRQKSDVTIHGGRIRGFTLGLRADDNVYDRIAEDDPAAASNILVEDLEVVDCAFRGIRVEARDATIRNCTVSGTGTGGIDGWLIMGIESYGPRPQVAYNTVLETRAPSGGEGVGISISDWGSAAQVHYNQVSTSIAGPGVDYGIWIGGVSEASVGRNLIQNFANGIAFSSTTSGNYFENDVQGASVPYLIGSANVQGDVPP